MTTWHARMIAPDKEFDGAPLIRGEFILDEGHGDVESATLFLSALGVVEAWVNGQRASEDLLTPGWSSFEWRVRYSELDVTDMVGTTTVIGLALGNGWYRGRLAWSGGSKYYGQELGAFAELRVLFSDGHQQIIGTDDSWTAGPSATTANDLYDGQSIDARRSDDAWLAPGFTSGAWSAVHTLDDDLSRLEPYIGPPVRRQMELRPVKVWTSPAGKVLVDFGQNLVGWVQASVTGAPGDVVTIRHAEVLEENELGTRPLRSAEATDRFTLSGGEDVFEPTLTFHGFRYAEVEGWPGGINALRDQGGLTAVVISSDMKRIGHFASSDPLLNRLHQNAVWGMRGNFVDVPTDCPQRDERLGWTGDLSAFAPSAAFLFDSRDFLRDWLRDLALEQKHDNDLVPFVVPNVLKYIEQPAEFGAPDTAAVWSDAAVWVPWALWTAYGDKRVLEEQFDSMTGHARRLRSKLSPNGLWDTGFQFGDWLDPDAAPDQPWAAKADKHVVATLCAFRTASLVASAAAVLGDDAAAAEFGEMAGALRTSFTEHYVSDGVILSDCTTVYALAIVFGILGDADRDFAGERLAELVAKSGFRISTGFAGTPFVTDALTDTGHLDEAYRLLLQTENPSWLYSVTMGATTIWERWDSMLPDGTINPGEMTSFNHYALGAVVDWMHRTIGGLAPLEPGYRRILIAPRPGGGLEWAETSVETPLGQASVRWELVDGRLEVTATVPEGSEAVLRLPGLDEELVGPGQHVRSGHPAELTFQ
ncbi:alpha-L-rhamnosidase [Arthrobacter sp. MYb23]|uniref:family 78 glycoside hydrolase catalytic domain n=1 Tax=unclassified Arthrobacter TaxID=235627 RepID=UPI000CFACCE8|nr:MULTISPECIES: family 78 glycoside hydrolase catalytic domain [unclassified Arthrobacter]PRB43308.1 alpha-L-rhamnosidase [Arthrobacter sp. MYb51]PRB97035.1 alpha-L-rhamnosidase [Arthrobacter sp. MYb23]